MKHTSKILALVLVIMTVLMSLSAITASAAVEEREFVFDASTLTAAADKEKVAEGAYDDFFSFVGTGSTKRWSDSKGVYAVELVKNAGSSIQFTIPQGAVSAKAVVSFASTGNSNESWVNIKDSTGALVGENASVTGTSYVDATFELSSGTYQVVGTFSSRGTRIAKIVVTYGIETCVHTGGTATCKDQAICDLCGASYGDLSTDHNYENDVCTVCGQSNPNACAHANVTAATCTTPATCDDCGKEVSPALGHTEVVDEAKAPTCTEKGLTEGSHCSVCNTVITEQTEIAALGHTLTFVNTLPTAEAAGKTVADCSVCDAHFDFGEVNVMTPGTYELDAADLAGIAQNSLFDGEVKVVDGVFACHLSYKYRTDENAKEFTMLGWTSTHRMNFGGTVGFLNNGEGEEAVRNGGLRNFIQIVTTHETTITIAWGAGETGRELAVYDMEGNVVAKTEEALEKNALAVSTLTVPAGSYLIGTYIPENVKGGGNYIFKMIVEVEAPHTHSFSEPTCTEPGKCECGETQGEALGHNYVDGVCSRCEAADPDYVPPVEEPDDPVVDEPVVDEPVVDEPAPELNFFQKIMAWFMDLINKFLAIFKK